MALHTADGPDSSGFEDISLVQDSLPELNMDDIDLGTTFLGKRLQYPVLINAITGGTEEAGDINRKLASLAGKYAIGMAVGSQTIALEDPVQRDSFVVVRDMNPDGLILANVSALGPVQGALQAIDMIQADALQLHLNVPQELAMREGDRNFKGIMDNIKRIVDVSPVPVIAKEVGFGLSRESVEKLHAVGVRIVDNGGKGGTNFLRIEDQREGMFDHCLSDWGISTAASLAEITALKLPVQIIASGGIRKASDLAKAIAMGADLVGISGFFLKILLQEGMTELDQKMNRFFYQCKAVFLMSGAQNCKAMQSKPLVITGRTADWLKVRGIDPRRWGRWTGIGQQ